MSQLQDNLIEIERQKDTYLLPGNLKTGVTCMGVTGTLTPAKEEQTKTINPSTSQQVVTPDTNKTLSQVTVNAVTSSIDNNIQVGNIKKNITILGVTGTYEGVKLFDTVEHMQQDQTAQEGDLAVVYRSEVQEITGDSEFSSCIFPNTVVLSEAFSDYIDGSFIAVDGGYFNGMVSMSSSDFSFDGWGEQMVRVQYESQDGITYTRTDGGEELQEFGTTIQWDDGYGEFNDVIGNFMKTGGMTFEGLYEYGQYTLDGTYKYMLNMSNLTASELPFKLPDIDTYTRVNELTGNTNCQQYGELIIVVHTYHLHSSGLYNVIDTCTAYQTYGGYLPNLVLYNNNLYVNAGTYTTTTSSPSYIVKDEYDFTLNNPLVSTANRCIDESISPEWTSNLLFASYDRKRARGIQISGDYALCFNYLNNVDYGTYNTVPKTTATTVDNTITIKSANATPTDYEYLVAPSQLTLSDVNQLPSNIIGYGKNGVVTGDGSIWNDLPAEKLYTNVLGLESTNDLLKADDLYSISYNNPYTIFQNNKVYGLTDETTANRISPIVFPKKELIKTGDNMVSPITLFYNGKVYKTTVSTMREISVVNDEIVYTDYNISVSGATILGTVVFNNVFYIVTTESSVVYCYIYDTINHTVSLNWQSSHATDYRKILLYDNTTGDFYLSTSSAIFKHNIVSNNMQQVLTVSAQVNGTIYGNSPYIVIRPSSKFMVYKRSNNSLLIDGVSDGTSSMSFCAYSLGGKTYVLNYDGKGYVINETNDSYEELVTSIRGTIYNRNFNPDIIQNPVNANEYIIDRCSGDGNESYVSLFNMEELTKMDLFHGDNNSRTNFVFDTQNNKMIKTSTYETFIYKYKILDAVPFKDGKYPLLVDAVGSDANIYSTNYLFE